MNAPLGLVGLLLLLAHAAAVQAVEVEAISFDRAWIRAAPPSSPVMAGYVRIANDGLEDEAITRAESADFGAVEIHEMRMIGDVMRMRPLPLVRIAPEEAVVLAPGGTHLMLFRPQRELRVGERATIDFVFNDGTRRSIEFEVREDAPVAD